MKSRSTLSMSVPTPCRRCSPATASASSSSRHDNIGKHREIVVVRAHFLQTLDELLAISAHGRHDEATPTLQAARMSALCFPQGVGVGSDQRIDAPDQIQIPILSHQPSPDKSTNWTT
jgi:hypothetical protein